MPAYTITQVGDNIRDWNSQRDGAMKSYRVTLTNDRGAEMANVEVSYKASDPVPQPGQVLNDVTIDTSGSYGPKVVFPRKFGSGGGPRGKSPEERRSIAMQHAQKCAVTILQIAAEHGDYKPPSAGDVVVQVEALSEKLFQQVVGAEKPS